MKRGSKRIGWLLLGWLVVPADGAGQVAKPQATSASAPALSLPAEPPPPAEEGPIAIADVAPRSELAIARFRSLAPAIESKANLGPIDAELQALGLQVDRGALETQAFLAEGPRIPLVDESEREWRDSRARLAQLEELITARAREADGALDAAKRERSLWSRTNAAAVAADAPPQVLARIQETEQEIEQVRTQLLALRERLLTLQDLSTRKLAAADGVLLSVHRYREAAVEDILTPTTRPLWRARLADDDQPSVTYRLHRETTEDAARSWEFLVRRADVFWLQLLGFVVLCALFRAARSRAARWIQRDPSLRDALIPSELPYSAAAVLALISSIWLHPALPRLLVNAIALLSLVPVLRILRRLVRPELAWLVYTFAGFFVLDRFRDFVAPAPVLEQIVLTLEMGAGFVLMLYLLSPRRLRGVTLEEAERRELRNLSWVAKTLLVAFGVAFVATLGGYMHLARVVTGAALGSVYVGMALYAAARAARGLGAFLLRIAPLDRLRAVQRHGPLLERRAAVAIGWAAAGLWVYSILRNLAFLGTPREMLDGALSASVQFGSLAISVGDVIGLGLTIWFAFLLSRFLRFLLDEEVYPRLQLAHGVPYAISSLANYAILCAGFLLAMASIGLDLNRFTVLAGAFGVGIGFGLQTIVNNFVSGLILLFERPIQIGDTVQVGDTTGDVKRIGIRSSTLRTGSGAEVIVPNSTFMSERVINWTLSDTSRRIELLVGVGYGADPERVLEMLREAARKHAEVLEYPEPVALILRFGENTIEFELRAWVQDGGRWPIIKTEIAVAAFRALHDHGIEIAAAPRTPRTVERREG